MPVLNRSSDIGPSLTSPRVDVHLGTVAGIRQQERVEKSPALILCGRCGADRVIPLTFTPSRRDDRHRDGWPNPLGRPRFKCIECRHLLDGTEPHWGRAPTKGELARYARTSRSGPGGP
jgi:hypothetical protein